jgi:hypothetical protein
MNRKHIAQLGAVALLLLSGTSFAQAPIVADGDFEADQNGKALRSTESPRGWYESRHDTKAGRLNLKLSTKKIYGNATHKAMLKGDPQLNTYLSQELAGVGAGPFTLRWDICVKSISPKENRSCFQMIGNDAVKGRGPNAAGAERFVFLGFENAAAPGKMNLFAFEGGPKRKWSDKTVLVRDLDLKKWYTIAVSVDPAQKTYRVEVEGVTARPVEVAAFASKKGKIAGPLTHVSFATWNDGSGTFYVDNVRGR